jgi:hypothetical protein
VLRALWRQAVSTLADLRHLARNPRAAYRDMRSSADAFRDLCTGGIVVSTAFPGAPAGGGGAQALRTVVQVNGDVALLVDRTLAEGDQGRLAGLAQAHAIAVREALDPIRRAQDLLLGLRASLRVLPAALGLGCLALRDLITALALSAATGAVLFLARLGLRHYLRHKARNLLA